MKFARIILAAAVLAAGAAQAGQVNVAVAANFTAPMKDLIPIFEAETGHTAIASFGATGAFFAQIKNGAPYQILLAADAKTPAKIEKQGLGVKGSSFPYAFGKLVLWSPDAKLVDAKGAVLKANTWTKCAVADPKLAPYGEAAIQTLEKLGMKDAIMAKAVIGNNIGKTFQFVKTANAQIGFIAMSQVYKNGKLTSGSAWEIPADYYKTIRQDAVLLNPGKDSEAAAAFLKFIQGPKAAAVKRAYGYGTK